MRVDCRALHHGIVQLNTDSCVRQPLYSCAQLHSEEYSEDADRRQKNSSIPTDESIESDTSHCSNAIVASVSS